MGPLVRVALEIKGEERFAHVSFKNAEDAAAAQHKFHNIPLDGARMNIVIEKAEVKTAVKNSIFSRCVRACGWVVGKCRLYT